jgi:hypothetical protein
MFVLRHSAGVSNVRADHVSLYFVNVDPAMNITIKVKVPKEVLNADRVRAAIEQTMRRKTGPGIKKLFEQTTDGWEHGVRFQTEHKFGSDRLSTEVYTTDDQYRLVNAGSPPHEIAPRNAPMLKFQPGYRASTRPRVLSSRSKQRFGGYVTSMLVHHPGFTAREFDQTVAEEYEPKFQEEIQDAINGAIRP